MKKNSLIKIVGLIIGIILIILLGVFIFINIPIKSIKIDTNLMNTYNDNLIAIKDTLDLITIPSEDGIIDWYKLKDNNKIDKDLKDAYEYFLIPIRNYYLYTTGEGFNKVGDNDSFSNSNFLANFTNKKRISIKEYNSIMKNYSLYNMDTIGSFYTDYLSLQNVLIYKDIKKPLQDLANYYLEIKNKKFNNYSLVLECEAKKSELIKVFIETLKNKLNY